jgi:4-amino-4-deoxy-L-arabinose transferase-like glycosyltransferase
MNALQRPRAGTLLSPHKVFTIIGVGCLLLAAAVYAHLRIAGNEDFTGSLAILDRVFDLAFVSALAALTFCIGRRLARVLQLEFLSVAEELPFSIMLGTGCLGLCVLGFGLLGLLKPLPLGLFMLFLIIVLRSELKSLLEATRKLLVHAVSTREQKLLSGLYLLVVAVLIVRASMPPWAVDEVIYHLPSTRLFVEQGRIYPLYHQPLGNMPFLIHMIYALCLLAKTDIAPKIFSLLLTLLTSVSLYGFSVRFLNRTVGLIAMFGFLTASMVVEVGVSSRIDVSLAGMLFLATYAMMIYLDSRNTRWLFASAILSGFSLGIKLNAGLWLACLGFMFLFESLVRLRVSFRSLAKHAALYVFITLAVSSPWLVKNLIWFHNPIYPFITGELADFTDGRPRYFNAEDEQKLDAHFDAARNARPAEFWAIKQKVDEAAKEGPHRHPMRFWEYYLNPHQYFMGDYHHYPSYLFLVLPFFVIVPRTRWLMWLLFFGLAFFLLVSSTSWIARFLLPIYPPLTIVSAYTLFEVSRRFAGRVAAKVCFLIIAFCMMIQLVVTAQFITSLNQLKFISGSISRSQFLNALFYYPPIDFINRNLPPDAGVLSIGGEMCYHMHRPYISDGSWDGTEWRRLLVRNTSLDEVNKDLKRQGISHVLFAKWYFELIAKTGWPKPGGSRFLGTGKFTDPARVLEFGPDYTSLRNWETFDRYRSEFLELVYTDPNGYEIYRLK